MVIIKPLEKKDARLRCVRLPLCATFLLCTGYEKYANAHTIQTMKEKEQKIVYNYYIIHKLYMQH